MSKVYYALALCLFFTYPALGLKCFSCDDCGDGVHNEVTCQEGEHCMKLNLVVSGAKNLKYSFEGRYCGKKDDHQACLDLGRRLNTHVFAKKLKDIDQNKTSAKCKYCDKDFCNASDTSHPFPFYLLLIAFLAALIQ